MQPPEQRRRYPRIPSENAVLVKKLGPEESEGFTKTKVVGLGGCMFLWKNDFGVGSYVDILIAIHHSVVKALAKVVYEIGRENGEVEVGAEFVQITDADRQLLETLWAKEENSAQ